MESSFSPREIVSELDKFIIGQNNAKKAVAVALRNRWRRKQLDDSLKEEIVPKNILMVGPTGCGKTEISRRLAKLANAPFVKVEATKFTEVGYVGRDVEQIVRDLVEISITKTKIQMGQEVKAKAEKNAEERILDVLVSKSSTPATRDNFRKKLRSGELNDNEVEIPVSANANLSLPTMDIPGMPGSQMGMINLGDVFGKGFGNQKKMKKMSVKDSHTYLLNEETDKLLDKDKINSRALDDVEQNGIVFIDEIDKITSRADRSGADVSREGVQRDLLPLIEGTAVTTKYGVVKTDYIKYIKRGYTRPTHLASIDIRHNRLTREEGEKIIEQYEGRRPPSLDLFLNFVGLTEDEFTEIVRSHVVSPHSYNPDVIQPGNKLADHDRWSVDGAMPREEAVRFVGDWKGRNT